MKLVKTLEGHTGIVHCLAVHKGKLMSGSDDKSIRVRFFSLFTFQGVEFK